MWVELKIVHSDDDEVTEEYRECVYVEGNYCDEGQDAGDNRSAVYNCCNHHEDDTESNAKRETDLCKFTVDLFIVQFRQNGNN